MSVSEVRGWALAALRVALGDYMGGLPGVADAAIYGGSAVGADLAAPKRPFVSITVGVDRDAGVGSAAERRVLSVWAYDDPGSYARIDAILGIARKVLPNSVPVRTGETIIFACDFVARGNDSWDDRYDAITQAIDFDVCYKER